MCWQVHPGSEVVNGCGAMLLSGQMPADLDTQGPLHIMTSMGPPGTKVMVAWVSILLTHTLYW